jgi:hypothetical protein
MICRMLAGLLLIAFGAFAGPPEAPEIKALLKPVVHKRALEEREVMASASLDGVPGSDSLKRYSFYTVVLIRSGLAPTRAVLTDYKIYKEIISYIDRADFDPATQTLHVEGGIWKFRLASWVRFEERSERWIRYKIVRGHFAGLEGDMLFEPAGEKGTLVLMRGEQTGTSWPPAFVLERGAEIVFGFTAGRMRSYVESQKRPDAAPSPTPGGKTHDPVPQPRRRL